MLKKKLLIAVAALGLSASAFATNGSPDIYVGGQLGYGDTHWNNISGIANDSFLGNSVNISDDGLAAGAYAGYDINQYFAVEGGYVYFPRTKVTTNSVVSVIPPQSFSDTASLDTYGLDAVGKITVPVVCNLGVFAKAGVGYLHTSSNDFGSTGNVNLVYGFGAQYQVVQNLFADVSFTRFNGDSKFNDHYQPDADLYAAGLSYKFNV